MAPPVHGKNAGILHHDHSVFLPHVNADTKRNKIYQGYGANVVLEENYIIEGLKWLDEDIVIEVSDPSVPQAFGRSPSEEFITLTLVLTNGRSTTCKPHAGESRKWHSSEGVYYQALSTENAGDCTLKFRKLAAPPGWEPDIPDPNEQFLIEECNIPCTNAREDKRCAEPSYDPLGGLGCMACGQDNCRLCGFGVFPDCGSSSTPNPDEASTTDQDQTPTTEDVVETTTGSGESELTEQCSCTTECQRARKDTRCEDPNSDPFGGLGCNACGCEQCRYCGFDGYPECGGNY